MLCIFCFVSYSGSHTGVLNLSVTAEASPFYVVVVLHNLRWKTVLTNAGDSGLVLYLVSTLPVLVFNALSQTSLSVNFFESCIQHLLPATDRAGSGQV